MPQVPRSLIAIDLDGTILDRSLRVSALDLEALFLAREAGMAISLLSGRTLCSMQKYVRAFAAEDICSSDGGALIFHPQTFEILHAEPMPKAMAQPILDHVRGMPVNVSVTEDDGIHFFEQDPQTQWLHFRDKNCGYFNDESILYGLDRNPWKMILVGKGEVLSQLQDDLAGQHPHLVFSRTDERALEVNLATANKGTALLWIADRLGIPAENTIAIGDSGNDIEMLKAARVGVAMGNAHDSVKAVADVIAPSVADSGVAWVIEQLLSGQL